MPPPQEGAVYHWRRDEVTPAGLITGPGWSFTGSATTLANRYEWNFAGGTLHPVRGNGAMTSRNAATQAISDYEVTDGIAVPHPDGTPASVIRVPALSAEEGIHLHIPLSRPNGNGTFINQCALIMDVLSPGANGWAVLFNTSTDNTNDAEWFIDPTGRLGIGTRGYAPAGTIAQNTWHRLALSADLGLGTVKYFVNGTLVRTRTGASQRDSRLAISTGESPGRTSSFSMRAMSERTRTNSWSPTSPSPTACSSMTKSFVSAARNRPASSVRRRRSLSPAFREMPAKCKSPRPPKPASASSAARTCFPAPGPTSLAPMPQAATWTELACSVHGAPFTGPGTVSETTPIPGGTLRRVTVRDVENIETNARRFTRVRVVADQ